MHSRRSEIASHISPDEGAVSTVLSRLKDSDLVAYMAAYWEVNSF